MKSAKKLIMYISAAFTVMLFACLMSLSTYATDSADGLWKYEILSDSTVSLVDSEGGNAYFGADSTPVIPFTIDGHEVTAIGENAFAGCDISEITIPSGVLSIDPSAFGGREADISFKGTCGSFAEDWAKANGYGFTSVEHWYSPTGVCVSGDDSLPADISLTLSADNGSVNISWTAVDDAATYDLYKSTDGVNFTIIRRMSETECTDNHTEPGILYRYSVIANNSAGKQIAASGVRTVSFMDKPEISLSNANGGVKVSWTEAEGSSGYFVYRKTEGGSYSKIATVTSLTYTDKSVSSGTKYIYAVRAYNAEVTGGYNNKSILYLASVTPSLSNDVTGIKISWTAVPGSDGYYVYKKSAGGSFAEVTKLTGTSFTDTDVVSGKSYTYAVRAYTGTVRGYYTAKSLIFLSSPQADLTSTAKAVNLTWEKVQGAEGYYLYKKESGGSYTLVATLAETKYTDTNVNHGNTYTYAVRAYSGTARGYYIPLTLKFPPYAGIDVSRYNGNIDFEKAKADKVDFVMIRCGTAYKHQYNKDIKFEENYANARKAGLKVGAYFYSYALNTSQARQEAYWCLEMIKGKSFEYPIAYDVEDKTMTDLSVAQLSAIIETFCDILEANGYKVCVYSSLSWYRDRISPATREKYDVWLAQWNYRTTAKHDYTIWQYTSDGNVNGLSGRVDMNWGYTDYERVVAEGGYNGYAKKPDAPKTTLSLTDDGIIVSWEAVKGARSYYVFRKTDNGLYDLVATVSSAITYLDTGVQPGRTYTYMIVPVNGESDAAYKETKVVYLSAPAVTLTNTDTGIKVAWNKVNGAEGYYLYRKTNGGSYTLIRIVTSASAGSFVDTKVKAGTSYVYTVRAYNNGAVGLFNGVGIVRMECTKIKLKNDASGITVSWAKVSGARGYWVYRKTGTGSYSRIAQTDSLSYTDKTAKSGTKYTYAVRAFNGTDLSSYESQDLLRIGTPSFSLSNTKDAIKLSWTKVAGVKGYQIYRKEAGGSYTLVATTISLSYTDKTAKAGKSYCYAVRAFNGDLKSAYNSVKVVRLTTPAVKLVNTKAGPKSSWAKVPGAKGYYVYRKTGSGSYKLIGTTSSLSYTDTTGKLGKTYTYAVRAYNGDCRSSYTGVTIKCK